VRGVPEPDGARRDLLREHRQPGAGPTATHGGHQGQPLNQGARPGIFLPVSSSVQRF
jgi:hypothetical protein